METQQDEHVDRVVRGLRITHTVTVSTCLVSAGAAAATFIVGAPNYWLVGIALALLAGAVLLRAIRGFVATLCSEIERLRDELNDCMRTLQQLRRGPNGPGRPRH